MLMTESHRLIFNWIHYVPNGKTETLMQPSSVTIIKSKTDSQVSYSDSTECPGTYFSHSSTRLANQLTTTNSILCQTTNDVLCRRKGLTAQNNRPAMILEEKSPNNQFELFHFAINDFVPELNSIRIPLIVSVSRCCCRRPSAACYNNDRTKKIQLKSHGATFDILSFVRRRFSTKGQ